MLFRSVSQSRYFNSGFLVPFYVDEVLPGDSFKLTATLFARLATPIVPFMDNLYLETFFFFVPNRLVWDNWQKFNGERNNPNDSTDFLIPTVSGTNVQNQTLWDYFGLPTNVNEALKVNALPSHDSEAPDNLSDYSLVRRGKRHDYFTSCLPWPQKGPGVEISIGGSADVSIPAGNSLGQIALNESGALTVFPYAKTYRLDAGSRSRVIDSFYLENSEGSSPGAASFVNVGVTISIVTGKQIGRAHV